MTNLNFVSSTVNSATQNQHQMHPIVINNTNCNNYSNLFNAAGPSNIHFLPSAIAEIGRVTKPYIVNSTPPSVLTNLSSVDKNKMEVVRLPSPHLKGMERRLKKPFMEKKRRERMNVCFDKLKEILMNSNFQQSSKLEKADVLEKTVAYLMNLQGEVSRLKNQTQNVTNSNNEKLYSQCVNEGYAAGMRDAYARCAGSLSSTVKNIILPPHISTPEFRNYLGKSLLDCVSNDKTTFDNQEILTTPNLHNSQTKNEEIIQKRILPGTISLSPNKKTMINVGEPNNISSLAMIQKSNNLLEINNTKSDKFIQPMVRSSSEIFSNLSATPTINSTNLTFQSANFLNFNNATWPSTQPISASAMNYYQSLAIAAAAAAMTASSNQIPLSNHSNLTLTKDPPLNFTNTETLSPKNNINVEIEMDVENNCNTENTKISVCDELNEFSELSYPKETIKKCVNNDEDKEASQTNLSETLENENKEQNDSGISSPPTNSTQFPFETAKNVWRPFL